MATAVGAVLAGQMFAELAKSFGLLGLKNKTTIKELEVLADNERAVVGAAFKTMQETSHFLEAFAANEHSIPGEFLVKLTSDWTVLELILRKHTPEEVENVIVACRTAEKAAKIARNDAESAHFKLGRLEGTKVVTKEAVASLRRDLWRLVTELEKQERYFRDLATNLSMTKFNVFGRWNVPRGE